MKIPFIINENTRKAFEPSSAATNLISEEGRRVKVEYFEWDRDLQPTLVECCLDAICRNFKDHPLLDELPCPERNRLLETLPTDLPLELVVPLIEDDYYWKRRYQDSFGIVVECKHPNWTWKCLYIEMYMQDKIEQAQPQYEDENEMDDITTLCAPYVHRLLVSQLQAWKPPLTWEEEEIPEVYPNDHINFAPIFKKLENVEELSLVYGMKNISDSFDWNMFKISVEDCKKLGEAVMFLPVLTILRINNSRLEDNHTQALMHGLIKNTTLTVLDLSHCHISDHGAMCIAKVIMEHPTLEILNLCNNKIGSTGGQALGYAIIQETCCPLYRLDMRLNPLGHDGVMGILRSLIRGTNLVEISLAACSFEDETSIRCSQMIKLNTSLKKIDVSNNWFDEEGGEYLVSSMMANKTVQWLDVRATDITQAQLKMINKALQRNRLGLDEIEEEEIVEESEDEQVEEMVELPVVAHDAESSYDNESGKDPSVSATKPDISRDQDSVNTKESGV